MKNQEKTMLKEARRLWALGFAIHWLHPKSKRPIGNKWTTGPRKTWKELEESFVDGYNVGVRTGRASKLNNGLYLTCIDIDIKNPLARVSALTALKEIVGNLKLPQVRSGSGNGSRHLYCATKEPFKMITAYKHADWEICIYSEGRQMALPPSIHPNGERYTWITELTSIDDLTEIDFSKLIPKTSPKKSHKEINHTMDNVDFTIDETLSVWWEPKITENIRSLIVKGVWKNKIVKDRSAYLFLAATALTRAGYLHDQILSLLTDSNTFLGKCAYDHAKTSSREKAALWLWNYTVKRAMEEQDAKQVFKKVLEYGAETKLSISGVKAQNDEFENERNWKQDLKRTGKDGNGPPAATLNNVELILSNDVSPYIVKRDLFAYRDVYGHITPWRGVKDEPLNDDDIAQIKYWLSQQWRLEVGKELIYDALTVIACRNAFDPVKDYLNTLPAWDKTPRLDTWLIDNFAARGHVEYLAQVFRKWMVAMIARVYIPGCKFDWMPIFEGAQGVGKSSFGRILVGDKHFLDWLPNLNDKDSALALQGMWGVELPELATMRRNDIEVIKGYITRTIDKVRPPFGRKVLEIPRRCVFYGTTNRDTYLRDETGNRRFKPVKVGTLNFNALERDHKQLFAEAKYLFDHFIETEWTLELTGEAKLYEAKMHAEKMVQDDANAMLEELEDFFIKQLKNDVVIDPQKFKLRSLFTGRGPLSEWPFNGRNIQFAAKALKMLGGENWKSDGTQFWKITKF